MARNVICALLILDLLILYFQGEVLMESSSKTNGLAIVSFVSGLSVIALLTLGLLSSWFTAAPGFYNAIRPMLDLSVSVQHLCAPIALVTGILALRDIQKKGGTQQGKRLAWVGIVLGSTYLLFVLLVTIIFSLQFLAGNS